MQLPLLPLPAGILSEWVPIADANYVRPAHSGEYDLGSSTLHWRTYYDKTTDTWACEGASIIWEYAMAWRGCTVLFVEGA